MIFQIKDKDMGTERFHQLVKLFDEYRCFYKQKSDIALAQNFLAQRITKGDSILFVATDEIPREDPRTSKESILGFVQLYPSFSSVWAERIWILNDLYVGAAFRKQGTARALAEKAKAFSIESGAKRIVLATANDNKPAQKLYESLGYGLNQRFLNYELNLK